MDLNIEAIGFAGVFHLAGGELWTLFCLMFLLLQNFIDDDSEFGALAFDTALLDFVNGTRLSFTTNFISFESTCFCLFFKILIC